MLEKTLKEFVTIPRLSGYLMGVDESSRANLQIHFVMVYDITTPTVIEKLNTVLTTVLGDRRFMT